MSATDARPPELSLDAPYRIGESTFAALVADLRSRGVRTMVEFGAGVSSVRLALELPGVRILSIESVERFCDDTRALASENGATENLTVVHRPLRWQRHGPYVYWSYARGELPAEIDAVLVDGPPFWTLRGREACLHQVAPHLRVGARVYLDDGQRDVERRVHRNWLAAHPGLAPAEPLDASHVVLVADVRSTLAPPRLRSAVLADNVSCAAARTATTARGYVRGAWRRATGRRRIR